MAESKENGEFDDSLKLIKQALWVCGIDLFETEQSIRIDNRFLFYITFVWLYYDVCGEIYCLYDFALSGKSVQEISLIAPFPFVCAMGTSKAACVYFHKDVALRVLRKLRDLHPKNDATFEVKTKEETMKLLSKFKILMCFGLSGAAILFDIAPFIAMGIDYYEIGHTQLKLPYLVKFFYDPYGMYVWPFEFVHQVGSSFVVVVSLFGPDLLFYAFSLYTRMQFDILCHRFERLNISKHKDTSNEFRDLVIRHKDLIELVNQIQTIFSISMLVNIIISSFIICLCGFNTTFINDIGSALGFFNFFINSLFQIFMICYFGDIIRDSSSAIFDAVYNIKWYIADPAFKNDIFILFMRSRKPCVLSAAGFTTLDRSTFATILSRSWSYFALLRTMYP